ncbi:hypothetical protein BT93_A1805 [Corymbia citriodora subsp. variegata]|nr:hypothetical protein BT93_A1805 [Corymbia citriodora subsp. variegata]
MKSCRLIKWESPRRPSLPNPIYRREALTAGCLHRRTGQTETTESHQQPTAPRRRREGGSAAFESPRSPARIRSSSATGDEDSSPNSITSAVVHIGSDVDQAGEDTAEGFIELLFRRNSHGDLSSESGWTDSEDGWERSSKGILLEDLLYSSSVFQDRSRAAHEEAQSSVADYFLGTDLDVLQQHLLGVDRHSRFYESMRAQKAVDAMPTVTIKEKTQCSICLENFEMGEEAKDTRCRHKYHGRCIFSWLELHRSCPLCRCRISPYYMLKSRNLGL